MKNCLLIFLLVPLFALGQISTKTSKELQDKFYTQLSLSSDIPVGQLTNVQDWYKQYMQDYKHYFVHHIKGGAKDPQKIAARFPELIEKVIDDFVLGKAPGHHHHSHFGLKPKKGPNDKGPGDPCQNMGFDNCDYSFWELTQGDVDANAYTFINPMPTVNWGNGSNIGFPSTITTSGSDQHFIVNGGMDPNAPIQMVNPLNGGTCSALIGDGTGTGARASKISQIFLVDSSNANFSYSYAAVLEDPSGHTLGEKPYFKARVYDQNGVSIACGEFQSTAGDGSPGWVNTGVIQYRDWSTVIVPLQNYIGQNVQVEFTVGDCSQTGHFGYAYVEASCDPLEILASDTVVCGAPVTLNAPSPFNGSYLWNTGDTTSSITTSDPGLYTVEMITGPGCSIILEVEIVADSVVPVANFVADTVCEGMPMLFTDISHSASGPVSNWSWDFDNDGIADDSIQNPTYTFPASGTYPVALSVGSGACAGDTVIDVTVADPPTAGFTTTDVCQNAMASFTDASQGNGTNIVSWEWDFNGDGIVDDLNQNPMHSFPSSGAFNVQLIVTSHLGCSDTISQVINIHDLPVVDFSFVNACLGDPIQFTDNSSVNAGNIIAWQWSFGNTNGSNAQNPSELYANQGVYNVQLTATSSNGCQNSVSKPVEVYPLPVANFSPTQVCLFDTTQFVDLSTVSNSATTNSIVQWAWDFNGLGSSTIQHPSFVFNQEGTVPTTLVVTTDKGCVGTITLNVTVNPLPEILFGSDTAACAPVCVNFSNSSSISSGFINTYFWEFGDGGYSGAEFPEHCFKNDSRVASKSYDVTLTATSDKGCSATLTKPNMITAYPIPLADFLANPEITDVLNKEVDFTDNSEIPVSWLWDFGDGGNSNLQNPSHEFPDAGSYIVTLFIENSYGCKDTFQREFIVRPNFAVWIPNAFTPDGDGTNEYFFVDGFGLDEMITRIYDRWGVELFYSEEMKAKWDGSYMGALVQQDVYVYKVKVKDVLGEWHDYVGRVTLIK